MTHIRHILLFFTSSFIFAVNATVTLDSSSDSVCPGDTVVFTCTTDTGELLWKIGEFTAFFNTISDLNHFKLSVYDLRLISKFGMNFISTATIDNVQLDHNGTAISCGDNAIPQISNTALKTVIIAGLPTAPLMLRLVCYNVSSAIISWVAPLNTPLCVHSYTVTVRNYSQVMVYNTTDNRSSLSFTDLTSDGEYSVTVAGRDGAGRLGLESEELNISLSVCPVNFSFSLGSFSNSIYAVLIQWKLASKFEQGSYLVTHNVSVDQSPIITNRANVTLYGVQPGQRYAVNITYSPKCACKSSQSLEFFFFGVEKSSNQTNDTVMLSTSTPVWVVPMIALPWLLLTMVILSILVYIIIIKAVKKSKRKGTASLHIQNLESSGNQVSATYYEEVRNVGRDPFTMMDNPSYAPSSVSKS